MPAVTPQRNRPLQQVSRPTNVRAFDFGNRIRVLYLIISLVFGVFAIRLFYLQVIRHDYYRKVALSTQLKEYQIPSTRGVIKAYDGNKSVSLVLNEKKYTLFADPKYIKDAKKDILAVSEVIDIADINSTAEKLSNTKSRYVVIAKKLSKEQAEKINKLKLKGIGTREESYRTYPQGSLASQLLGFVNDEGEGQYGIEQSVDKDLKGTPGSLKAITDAAGVPLVSIKDNIIKDPVAGSELQLTIDIGLQRQVEDILKNGLDRAKSKSGSLMVMEVKTGAVKAMANYPTYDPGDIKNVEDVNSLSNAVVSSPLEVGSIMKVLTVAAAIDKGVLSKNSTFTDNRTVKIDDTVISNVEEDGGRGVKSVGEILRLSLNTGAVFALQQMGGGSVNEQSRNAWYDYMTNKYGFGAKTGIEQTGEAIGIVPSPSKGFGLNVRYATSSFGQGTSQTLLQMAAAYASVVNGGNYYQPRLVDKVITDGKAEVKKPKLLHKSVSESTSNDIKELMEYAFSRNHKFYGLPNLPAGYRIGGKTGSSQIASPDGGYYDDRFNGTFAGYIGGDEPEYIVLVRVNEPGIGGYAGARAAAPVFIDTINMMVGNFGLTPKGT